MSPTAFPITWFAASQAAVVGGVLFVATLAIASVSDIRTRRIPNALVLTLALAGILFSVVTLAPAAGLMRSLLGFALGFAIWIPFYALGMLGAGDVKLFAAGCCWLAPSQVFGAAVIAALAGGVLSIVGLVLAHGVGLTTMRVAHAMRDPRVLSTPLAVPAGRRTLPYGLAIAIGLCVVAWFPQLLRL
jgi:prepilin peptidase CpaA